MASAPNLDPFPADLKALHRWVTWRYETRNSKRTKRPEQSVANERAWLSFADACERVPRGNADGVGFVLGDGIAGIDIDGCVAEDGILHDVARDAIEMLGTYGEKSPSGRGLHFLIRAAIERPRKIHKSTTFPGLEVYDGRNGSARYFTVTGDRLDGCAPHLAEGPQAQAALKAFIAKWFPEEEERQPVGIAEGYKEQLDDDTLLRVMFGAKDGVKWRAVFNGDLSPYRSQSEADLALCGKLRFYAHGNRAQTDRLFRRSALMRLKWDERHGPQTYGEVTIKKAIGRGGPYYTARNKDAAKTRGDWERTAWAKVPFWYIVRLQGAGELALRVLAAIASHADKKGEAYPSVETIAAHCRVSPRRVKAAIAKLKAAGIVTSTQRSRQSNLYQLAQRVPEVITPLVARRIAGRVPEPGHLGCPRHRTVTDQEPTTVNTGGAQRCDDLESRSNVCMDVARFFGKSRICSPSTLQWHEGREQLRAAASIGVPPLGETA